MKHNEILRNNFTLNKTKENAQLKLSELSWRIMVWGARGRMQRYRRTLIGQFKIKYGSDQIIFINGNVRCINIYQ